MTDKQKHTIKTMSGADLVAHLIKYYEITTANNTYGKIPDNWELYTVIYAEVVKRCERRARR